MSSFPEFSQDGLNSPGYLFSIDKEHGIHDSEKGSAVVSFSVFADVNQAKGDKDAMSDYLLIYPQLHVVLKFAEKPILFAQEPSNCIQKRAASAFAVKFILEFLGCMKSFSNIC